MMCSIFDENIQKTANYIQCCLMLKMKKYVDIHLTFSAMIPAQQAMGGNFIFDLDFCLISKQVK